MKALIFAYVTLAAVIATVFINSFAVSDAVGDMINSLQEVENSTDNKEKYIEIYDEFKRYRKYINLTVSHDIIMSIEENFAEILGALEADDEESLIITKSRLISELSHLKRLSGINSDSIF